MRLNDAIEPSADMAEKRGCYWGRSSPGMVRTDVTKTRVSAANGILPIPVSCERRSLFLPVLKFYQKLKDAMNTALSYISGKHLAVFSENHPVFGK
jgi:hypothetical protein